MNALPVFKYLARPPVLAVLLVLAAVAQIVSTYTVFTQTYDESYHIACGMEWLDRGRFDYFHESPPLARVAAALGPYLAGVRSFGEKSVWVEGNRILGREHYGRNLALARLGELPFFLLACAVLWLWTRRLFGEWAAVLAILLFTTLPPILGHAGLATTDMASAACLFATLYALMLWLERPDWRRTLALGGFLALAVLAKFSAFVFVPSCGAAALLLYIALARPSPWKFFSGVWRRAPAALVALAFAALAIWAGYRFSYGAYDADNRTYQAIDAVLREHPLPAPELFDGMAYVQYHAQVGHDSWLLGEFRRTGWWYFYPIALAVKTPLPFLALAAFGIWALIRAAGLKKAGWEHWSVPACAVAILLICLPTKIDLGVRHILAVYPFLAMAAAVGAVYLFGSQRALMGLGIALLAWQAVATVAARPDFMAWFNELAGSRPERILAESDLDWGQDLKRLSQRLRQLGVKEVSVAYFGSADLDAHGLPPWRPLPAYTPVNGWIAVSIHMLTIQEGALKELLAKDHGPLEWLARQTPVERVGKSILLYHIQ